jgi:hypothetical protein
MIVSPKASFRVCACGLLVLCQAGMGQSGAESALDASDIDSGWDLLGDLREALPDVATNGAAEGRAPPIQALRLVSPACAFTPCCGKTPPGELYHSAAALARARRSAHAITHRTLQ